jgi:hypothetical protein
MIVGVGDDGDKHGRNFAAAPNRSQTPILPDTFQIHVEIRQPAIA